MRIYLVTYSYPFPLAVEDCFLDEELRVFSLWSRRYPENELVIVPGNRDHRDKSKSHSGFKIDYSLINSRKKLRYIRRTLIMLKMVQYMPMFIRSVRRCKNLNLKRDILRFIQWCDQVVIAEYALRIDFLRYANDGDLIYTWWLCGYTFALSKFANQSTQKYSLVSRAHGGDLFCERGVQVAQIESVKGCRMVYPSSIRGFNELKMRTGGANNIKIGRLGVSKSRIYDSNHLTEIMSAIHNSTADVIILTISNLNPVKSLDLLMLHLNEIAQQGLAVEWHHIGERLDPLIVAVFAAEYCENLKIKSFGQFKNEDVRQALNRYADSEVAVMINYSSSEGTAISLVEAVEAGCPVIGRDVGGVSEIVTHQTGYLLPSEPSAIELKDALEYVLKNVLKIRTLNKIFWLEEFDADKLYNQFYDDLNLISKHD